MGTCACIHKHVHGLLGMRFGIPFHYFYNDKWGHDIPW